MDKEAHIDTFARFAQVSRETIISLKIYENLLIQASKGLNLIGHSTINQIWIRHFLDSSQVIDFIDKNDKTMVDIGTGAGFPGLIIAILAKDRKIPLKIKLIDKSPRKVKFLKDVITKLKLDVKVSNENILEQNNELNEDLIISRAFKPLKIILELIHKKGKNWRKIFIFLGKTGQNELLRVSNNWDIEYKQRMSVTNSDSIIIEINNLEKK